MYRVSLIISFKVLKKYSNCSTENENHALRLSFSLLHYLYCGLSRLNFTQKAGTFTIESQIVQRLFSTRVFRKRLCHGKWGYLSSTLILFICIQVLSSFYLWDKCFVFDMFLNKRRGETKTYYSYCSCSDATVKCANRKKTLFPVVTFVKKYLLLVRDDRVLKAFKVFLILLAFSRNHSRLSNGQGYFLSLGCFGSSTY